MSLVVDFKSKDRYLLDGVALPSVTEILKATGFIDDKWFDDFTTQRGRAVHKATEYLDQGCLEFESLDEHTRPYVLAYSKFKADIAPEVLAIEESLYDPLLKIAGTLDRRGKINGKEAIWDIKTGTPQDHHGVQLAGYDLLALGGHNRYGIYLKNDMTYTMVQYQAREDKTVFLSAVNIYYWRKQHE